MPTVLDVQPTDAGQRLDAFVAHRTPLSRSQVEKLARDGRLLVNGRPAKPSYRLQPGDTVALPTPPAVAPGRSPIPDTRAPIPVLFEDDAIIVVNKPPGLAVHPGAGRPGGTLVDLLLARTPALARSGGAPERPGIVHRLDRDTSGVMVVAKTAAAYDELSRQVRRRTLDRRYLALAWGRIPEDRLVIDVPIGRALAHPTRMVAAAPTAARQARPAVTDLWVQQRFPSITLVEARLVTGRTHQIRLHLAHIGHPVVGDPVYGRRVARRMEAELDADTLRLIEALPGQALHAQSLAFRHPVTGQQVRFAASPYPELARLLVHLKASVV